MIRLNIDQKTLEDKDLLIPIINKLLYIKMVSEEGNQNHDKLCFDYYKGLEPQVEIKKNSDFKPKVFNFAKPITDIATKVFIGELPDIVSLGSQKEKNKISVFNQKLYKRNFGTHIFATGKNSSICGNGFVATYNEIGDKFPRFRALNPQFADVVYDCTLAQKPLLAFNVVENEKLVGNVLTKNYIVYVYTSKKLFVYETNNRSIPNPMTPNASKDFIVPLNVFVSNGQELSEIEHGFSDIPIIEFANNEEHTGDFECVMELIKAYNLQQNNRLQNVDEIINYVLLVKNARFGNEEETKEAVELLNREKILALEGEDVDAKFLSNPLNQSEMQTLASDIKSSIHYISRVPDLSSVDFSQNASDPIIKIKTKPLIDLCAEKELSFNGSYMKLLKLVLDFCEKNDKEEFEKYNFDLGLCSLEYAHDLPSNDLDMATQIVNLNSAGILNPDIATQRISWIKNAHDYMKGANKWNESVDIRKIIANNKNNGGTNETNLKRQNDVPMKPDQLDNKRNGALGVANKIDENKVE